MSSSPWAPSSQTSPPPLPPPPLNTAGGVTCARPRPRPRSSRVRSPFPRAPPAPRTSHLRVEDDQPNDAQKHNGPMPGVRCAGSHATQRPPASGSFPHGGLEGSRRETRSNMRPLVTRRPSGRVHPWFWWRSHRPNASAVEVPPSTALHDHMSAVSGHRVAHDACAEHRSLACTDRK